MILHYVEKHLYLPSQQFMDAVLRSPMPGTLEYTLAVTDFRELYLEKLGAPVDVQSLHEYHEQLGSYPLKLEQVTGEIEWFLPADRWGTPLVYLSSGDSFVLVSMGLGGQPDGDNYLATRLQTPRRRAPGECSDPQIDQIVTDQGWYRECGK